jgi:uncharacterized protein (TIGR02246 family)
VDCGGVDDEGACVDEIARLLDERAIGRLLVDYCRFVDFGEASRIADLFTDDGVWESSDGFAMVGRDQIRAGFGRREGVARRTSRHVITNVSIDLSGTDDATALCYLINYRHDSPTGVAESPAPVGHPKFVGEYRDRLVRTSDGWRFAHRHCDLTFVRASGAPS